MLRNHYIDYLKGLLILLVTIGHSIQFALYQNSNFWDDPIFKFIYMFHMPLFMGVSGYLSYSSIQKRNGLSLIAVRARSYLTPVLAWSILFQLYQLLTTNNTNLTTFIIDTLKYSAQTLWFLWALFACLFFTSIIKRISSKYFWQLYLASFPLSLLIPEIGNIHLFKYVYPFYQIGFFIASKPFKKIKPIYFISAVILTLAFYILWDYHTYIYTTRMKLSLANLDNITIRYLAGFFSCIAIGVLSYSLYVKSNQLIKKIFSTLGEYTLQIYIVQNFTFMAILYYSKLYFTTPTNYLALTILTIIISAAMCIFCICIGKLALKNRIINLTLFGTLIKKS